MRLVCLLIFVLMGCAHAQATPAVNEARKAFHSTVALELANGDVYCSGVIVRRVVLTAEHCVAAAFPTWVRMADGTKFEVALGMTNHTEDLAILMPIGVKLPRGVRVARKAPTWGDEVWVIGHPLGKYEYSITRGVVSYPRRTNGIFGGVWLQHDAGTVGGNSGGPVLDGRGRLVGITSFGIIEPVVNGFGMQDTHLAGAVHLEAITRILANAGL